MNPGDSAVRPGALLHLRLAAGLLTIIAIGLAFVLIFLPPLHIGFVSDTFGLYERARAQSPSDLIALFVPDQSPSGFVAQLVPKYGAAGTGL